MYSEVYRYCVLDIIHCLVFIYNTILETGINSVQFVLVQKSMFGDTASRYRTITKF
jgi:hypothetical protein